MTADPRADQQVELAAEWNANYPPGTVVRYWPDGPTTGRGALGTTATEAKVINAGLAAVKLHERGTVVALARCRPVPSDRCRFCRELIHADNPDRLLDKLAWHQWDHHRAEARAEAEAANVAARRAAFQLLYRALGRGWLIFADRPAGITEVRTTYWYAVRCPRSTPAEEAVKLPGLLKHTDPYQLALLGRAAMGMTTRRAA